MDSPIIDHIPDHLGGKSGESMPPSNSEAARDNMCVSKDNFRIASTVSQKTLKGPRGLKIDNSVVRGK